MNVEKKANKGIPPIDYKGWFPAVRMNKQRTVRMRRVYSSSYIADCDQLRMTLSGAGIESMMKNEFGNPVGLALFGGVAAFAEPEVWVDEADYEEAIKIVEEVMRVANGNDSSKSGSTADSLCGWQCPNCGEAIEGTMNACWKCETERPHQQTETPENERNRI